MRVQGAMCNNGGMYKVGSRMQERMISTVSGGEQGSL